MSGTLKRRLRAHAREHHDDGSFVERLLELADRIEQEFAGEQQEQLLALAQDTFERHVHLRRNSAAIREGLDALRADQRRLLDLLDFLARTPGDARIH